MIKKIGYDGCRDYDYEVWALRQRIIENWSVEAITVSSSGLVLDAYRAGWL